MNDQIGLTVKHVHENGNTAYLGAVSVELVWPDDRPCYLKIECGSDNRREAYTGKAYLINAQGKTIEVFHLDSIAPSPTPPKA